MASITTPTMTTNICFTTRLLFGDDGTSRRQSIGESSLISQRQGKLLSVDFRSPPWKLQVQGVHHITIVGSTKQSAIDFWQGALGMPFVFEQPNLGKPDESHLYFDPGDGRLLTVFTNESREDARRHAPREIGCVEHIAFNVSRPRSSKPLLVFRTAASIIQRHRGFMDSIYLHDPNGLKIELACYNRTARGLPRRRRGEKAHRLRVERGDITSPPSTSPTRSSCCWRPGLACRWRSRSPRQ